MWPYNHYYRPQNQINDHSMWLRGEFAAANAIIDALCHHLQLLGEPGEYDGVMGSIQQRRCNWGAVLDRQQHFPVTEVLRELQQAGRKRQQRKGVGFDKEGGRGGFKGKSFGREVNWKGFRNGQMKSGSTVNEKLNGIGDEAKEDENKDGVENDKVNGIGDEAKEDENKDGVENDKVNGIGDEAKEDENKDGVENDKVNGIGDEAKEDENKDGVENDKVNGIGDEAKEEETKDDVEKKGELNETYVADARGSTNAAVPYIEEKVEVSDSCNVVESKSTKGKRDFEVIPKTFVAQEMCGGIQINVVEGLKLFVKLIEESDISKLLALVSGLRADGEMGKFKGLFSSKRPMNGHGRVVIQLGNLSPHLHSRDADTKRIRKDLKPEPIPALLQDVIEQLVTEKVVTIKPDSCIIDIYLEGDYSPPSLWPESFGRPVCLLFLTKCEMSFGRSMPMDRQGEFKGVLKLVVSSGSMLVMEGYSADVAKHSLLPTAKKRTLVTFFKSQPRKTLTELICGPAVFQHWSPPLPERPLPPHVLPIPPRHGRLMTSSPVGGPLMNPHSDDMYIPMVPAPSTRSQGPGTGFFLPSKQTSAFHHQFELTSECNVSPPKDDNSRQVAQKDSQEK